MSEDLYFVFDENLDEDEVEVLTDVKKTDVHAVVVLFDFQVKVVNDNDVVQAV